MSDLPADLRYAESHEWVRLNDDGTVTIGITDHAQEQLGELVFVECPDVGATCTAGENCAVVESVKAASDIYAPLSGEVVAVNESLEDAPERVNEDAYGEGWLFSLQPDDATALDEMLNSEAYSQLIDSEDN